MDGVTRTLPTKAFRSINGVGACDAAEREPNCNPMVLAALRSVAPVGAIIHKRGPWFAMFWNSAGILNQIVAVKSLTTPKPAPKLASFVITAQAPFTLPMIGLALRFIDPPRFCTPELAAPWRSVAVPVALFMLSTTG